MVRSWSRLAGLVGVCGLAACATSSGPPLSKSMNYLISSSQAEFFKYGPAQAFGPDLSLPRGQAVTLLKREFGYSRVQLPDGTPGYVATEDLALAPPPAIPPRLAARGAGHASGRRTSGPPVTPTKDPLFDINDVPNPPLPAP